MTGRWPGAVVGGRPRPERRALSPEEDRFRPLYARVLRLRFVNPGGMLCFVFFEGSIALAVLLALAELVDWWTLLILPALVAALIKANDLVVAVVVRSAARVPERERERFRRQMEPAIGRAAVRARGIRAVVMLPARSQPSPRLGRSDPAPAGLPWRDHRDWP